MTVLRQVVESASDATLKGRVLNALGAQEQGINDTAILDLTVGALVDGETFSLGSNVFELTDSAAVAETATGSAASGDNKIVLNVAPDRDFVKGEVFRVDAEHCLVTSHLAGSVNVFCDRAYAGTTAGTHAAEVITRIATARLPITGNIVLPLVDPGTDATVATDVELAIPALRPEYGASSAAADTTLIDVAFSDAHPANSIVTANANTLANFAGGEDSFGVNKSTHLFKAVASTAFSFTVPNTPVAVAVYVFDDSAGLLITGDTTSAIAGRTITITEGAAPVWENGVDSVLVEVYY